MKTKMGVPKLVLVCLRLLTLLLISFLATPTFGQQSAVVNFPLNVSVDRRYLVDATGAPFLLIGDTAWFLVTNLSKTDAELYLENRRVKGYNAINAEAIVNKTYTWNPPYNKEGNAPFKTPGDFSTPNDLYFLHLDWLIAKAAEKGIVVILSPAYLGYGAGSDGWWEEIVKNGPTKCRNYGRYIGSRYKSFKNIVYVHGGDYNPPKGSQGVTNALEILKGIKDEDPAKLHTFHGARFTNAFDEPTFGSYLQLDATYSGDLTYTESLLAYNRAGFGPHFLYEGRYEGKQTWDAQFNSPSLVRAGAYWSQLSGSTGQISGIMSIWTFGWQKDVYGDWRTGMEASTSFAMKHFKALFQTRAWHKLVPDQSHVTVTSGYGTKGQKNYVAAARTADGSLVMAYVPSTGVTTHTLTLNMTRLSGNATARWFNPTSAVYKTISGSPFANSGSRNFITPGDNGTGTNDWVLVLERLEDTTPPAAPQGLRRVMQ